MGYNGDDEQNAKTENAEELLEVDSDIVLGDGGCGNSAESGVDL